MLKCWSDKDCHRPQFQDLYEELDLYIKNEQVRSDPFSSLHHPNFLLFYLSTS